jgi:putative heme transporter
MQMAKPTASTPSKRRQLISTGITILFLVAVFAFVLPLLGDYDEAWGLVRSLDTAAIGALAIVTIVNILVYVLPFIAVLPGLSFWRGFVLRQATFVIANALPGGGAIGIGIQYAMLGSYGYSGTAATAAIILTGWWNMLATISLPGLAGLALLLTGEITRQTAIAAGFGLAIAAFSLGTFFLIFRSKALARRFGDWLDRLDMRLRKRMGKAPTKPKAQRQILSFRSTSYDTVMQRWHLLAISNVLQQLAQFAVLYVALNVLQPEGTISVTLALGLFALARLGTFIPLSPAGVGTVDAIMVSLLIGAGVPNEAALASTLIWRFLTLVPQLLIGALMLALWRSQHDTTHTD